MNRVLGSDQNRRACAVESTSVLKASVWLVNPYGPLPSEQWREYRFTTLGRALTRAGYNVTWWTADFSHHFKVHRHGGWAELSAGPHFRIRLVPTPGYRRHIGIGRLWFEAVFAARLYAKACHEKPPALIIAPDTPQVVAAAAARLARRFGAKLVVDVMDLWPELFELAVPQFLREVFRPLFWPFHALRRAVRRKADAITALCPSYLHHAIREAPPRTMCRVVYNGIDVSALRAESLLPDEKVDLLVGSGKQYGEIWAVFAGTIGNNYDIECLASAALLLKDAAPPIHIWVAGNGPLRHQLLRAVRVGAQNLHVIGQLEHSALASLYRRCDVGLCAYARGSNVGMPDKAYDYLAMGLPIVSSLTGDLKELIETKRIGLFYEAGDPHLLAGALQALARNPSLRMQMSENASALGRQFNSAEQYDYMVELVRLLADSRHPMHDTVVVQT